MIAVLFGFRGRLNRTGYLLAMLAAVLATGLAFALLYFGWKAMFPGKSMLSVFPALALLGVFCLFQLWMSLSIQAARLRDLGLPPLPMLTLLLAINLLYYVAPMIIPIPSIALVVVRVCHALSALWALSLLFIPSYFFDSGADDDDSPAPDRRSTPVAPAPIQRANPVGAQRQMFGQRSAPRR